MPYFQDHVVAGRRDNSIFSIELHTGDEVFMSFYLFLLFAKVQVPNPNSLIVWWAIQIFSTWVQRETSDPVIMTDEGVEVLPGLSQEEFD